jgi:hypothetical protein
MKLKGISVEILADVPQDLLVGDVFFLSTNYLKVESVPEIHELPSGSYVRFMAIELSDYPMHDTVKPAAEFEFRLGRKIFRVIEERD